jgi:outer membrane protein assembly factor BamB
VAIDFKKKLIKWFSTNSTTSVDSFGNIRSTPIIYDECLIYANTTTNQLIGISIFDGSCAWALNLGRSVYYQWSSPIEHNGMLYIGRGDGLLYILDLKAKSLIFAISLMKENRGKVMSKDEIQKLADLEPSMNDNKNYGIIGTPVIYDDTLFVGTSEGYFIAMKVPQ